MQAANASVRAEMTGSSSIDIAPLGEAMRPSIPYYYFNVLGTLARLAAVAASSSAAAHKDATRSGSGSTLAATDSLAKDWCQLSVLKGGWADDDPLITMRWEQQVLAAALDWVVNDILLELGTLHLAHEARLLPSLNSLAPVEPCPELIWLRMAQALMLEAGQLRAASIFPAHDLPAGRIGTGVCMLLAGKQTYAQQAKSSELGMAAVLSGLHAALSQVRVLVLTSCFSLAGVWV